MKKILITLLIAAISWVGIGVLSPTPASAATGAECEKSFLTFRPWYYGLVEGNDCKFKDIGVNGSGTIELSAFVWGIILNILSILFGIIGYLAIGFVIYGGFLYVMARGDPGRIAKGKSTVIRALVGLVICILASLISNLIVNIITEAVTT